MRRRQDEKAAGEHQAAADQQESTNGEKKMTLAEPQTTDPQAETGEPADQKGHWLGQTKTPQDKLLPTNPEPEKETKARHRSKAECKLAGLLKTGMEHLPPDRVQRIIWVAREGAVGSPVAIYRLEGEVQELINYYPSENQDEQMEDVLRAFQDDMLDTAGKWWRKARQRGRVRLGMGASGRRVTEDPGQSLDRSGGFGRTRGWAQQGRVGVSGITAGHEGVYLALKICDDLTKADWGACAYSRYK
jgi:hypothetical protein